MHINNERTNQMNVFLAVVRILDDIRNSNNSDWPIRMMETEYRKEYENLKRLQGKVTTKDAMSFLQTQGKGDKLSCGKC
jgi:predicted RNase H-like nuclease (RuvC/YqgF family)